MNRFNKLALAGAVGSLMAGPGVDAATPSFSLYQAVNVGGKLVDTPLPGSTGYPYEQYLADGWSGARPDYKGGLPATWYVPLAATDAAVVETADMPGPEGMAIEYLNVGSSAYVDDRHPSGFPPTNWGYNADFGLFLLDAASDVTITVSSDPLLINGASGQGFKVAAGLRPGFSVWQGWDTVGGTRHGTWLPNGYPALQPGAPSPFLASLSVNALGEMRPQADLGQFMGTAWTYTSDGSAVLKLKNVPAGKYTIVMGGVTDAAAGATAFPGASKQYKASFRTTPAGSRPSAARTDLNGNGKADLVWRNTLTGETELWSMDGNRRQESLLVDTQPKGWVIAAVTDFDGDGEADILWRNPTSWENTIWLMNGGSVVGTIELPDQAKRFSVVRGADFQNDRQAEILWLDPASGEISVWLVHKGHFGVEASTPDFRPVLPIAPAGKDLVAIADFNGNGTPDLWWRDGASGDNTLWLLSGVAYESPVDAPNQGSAWSLAGAGDFDGDGTADAIWRNDQTGDNEIWLMDEGGTRKSAVSLPKLAKAWTLARVDDFNGDGQVDLFWRHPRSGKNKLWTMEGTAPKSRRNVPELGKAWTTPPD